MIHFINSLVPFNIEMAGKRKRFLQSSSSSGSDYVSRILSGSDDPDEADISHKKPTVPAGRSSISILAMDLMRAENESLLARHGGPPDLVYRYSSPKFPYAFYLQEKGETLPIAPYSALLGIAQSTDPKQVFVMVASYMIYLAPSLKDAFVAYLRWHEVDPIETFLPKQCKKLGLSSVIPGNQDMSLSRIMVNFCVFLMLMFKNIHKNEYKEFMKEQIRALRGILGLPKIGSIKLPIDPEKARGLREICGSDIKQPLVDFLINHKDQTREMKSVLRYTASVIAWSDMEIIHCIDETLYRTNSPVLKHSRVIREVVNLYYTIREIRAAKYPQFFVFKEGASRRLLLETNRFRVLAAVACKIRREHLGDKTMMEFVAKGCTELVDELPVCMFVMKLRLLLKVAAAM